MPDSAQRCGSENLGSAVERPGAVQQDLAGADGVPLLCGAVLRGGLEIVGPPLERRRLIECVTPPSLKHALPTRVHVVASQTAVCVPCMKSASSSRVPASA
jgi:hypothetical protein